MYTYTNIHITVAACCLESLVNVNQCQYMQVLKQRVASVAAVAVCWSYE